MPHAAAISLTSICGAMPDDVWTGDGNAMRQHICLICDQTDVIEVSAMIR